MGIFGTTAEIIFDINLIVQAVLVAMLVIGWVKRKPYKDHGTIMAVATIVNLVTVLTIMAPSLILNFDALVASPTSIGSGITIVHSIVGSIAIGLGLLFGVRFLQKSRAQEPLLCGGRRLMWATLILWLYSFGGGTAFYIFYYI